MGAAKRKTPRLVPYRGVVEANVCITLAREYNDILDEFQNFLRSFPYEDPAPTPTDLRIKSRRCSYPRELLDIKNAGEIHPHRQILSVVHRCQLYKAALIFCFHFTPISFLISSSDSLTLNHWPPTNMSEALP